MKRGSPLRRRTPLRSRPRPRRRSTPEWTPAQWDTATSVIHDRQHGRCDWCGQHLAYDAVRHHRVRRRDGGDTYPNVVLLHDHCHKHIHQHPDDAKARGFIVPPWQDPQVVALDVAGITGQASWTLNSNGTRTPRL